MFLAVYMSPAGLDPPAQKNRCQVLKQQLLLFIDLVAGSPNKEKHSVMKLPVPGCIACHHNHSGANSS